MLKSRLSNEAFAKKLEIELSKPSTLRPVTYADPLPTTSILSDILGTYHAKYDGPISRGQQLRLTYGRKSMMRDAMLESKIREPREQARWENENQKILHKLRYKSIYPSFFPRPQARPCGCRS